MQRFSAIEGARGWLAWAVVFSHIGQTLGIGMRGEGHWVWMGRGGTSAVLVFIAISGFVITHLLLTKEESYRRYIVRRACRIFPAYWIAYAAAIAVLPLALDTLNYLPWRDDPAFGWTSLLHEWANAFYGHTWPQVISHALLLHGVIPDSVLQDSGTAVLGPAWSLTLEWQFYLVAPLVVWGLANTKWRIPTIVLILLAFVGFRDNLYGRYSEPTFLPGAAYIFMIGIGCRLGFAQAQRTLLPPAAALGCLVLGIVYPDMLWLAIWAALYLFLLNGERWRSDHKVTTQVLHAALESKPAQYFGARSYAVYLVHLPLLQLMTWLIVTHWRLDQAQLFAAVTVTTVPGVIIVSDLLHRFVEQPFIKLGARLAAPRAATVRA